MNKRRSFIFPTIIGTTIFYFIPLLMTFAYSMMKRKTKEVGVQNYIDLLNDKLFLLSFRHTMLFAIASIVVIVILGLVCASAMVEMSGVKQIIIFIVITQTAVMPSGLASYLWKILFSNGGFINRCLESMGCLAIDFNTGIAVWISLLILFVWKYIAYSFCLYVFAMKRIPVEYNEVARMETSSWWKIFVNVTWPCLKPVTVLVVLITSINVYKIYKEMYLIWGAYPSSDVYMLQHYFSNEFRIMNVDKMCTAAIFVILLSLLIICFIAKFLEKINEKENI